MAMTFNPFFAAIWIPLKHVISVGTWFFHLFRNGERAYICPKLPPAPDRISQSPGLVLVFMMDEYMAIPAALVSKSLLWLREQTYHIKAAQLHPREAQMEFWLHGSQG